MIDERAAEQQGQREARERRTERLADHRSGIRKVDRVEDLRLDVARDVGACREPEADHENRQVRYQEQARTVQRGRLRWR
jgi:hypothetical protein